MKKHSNSASGGEAQASFWGDGGSRMAMVLPRLHAHPPPASYLVGQSKCTAWSYNKEAGVGGVNAFRTNKDGSGSLSSAMRWEALMHHSNAASEHKDQQPQRHPICPRIRKNPFLANLRQADLTYVPKK